MATFRAVLPTFPFSGCLRELVHCYTDAIRKAGHAVTISDSYLQPGEAGEDFQLAFGAHNAAPPEDPSRLVVAQSEHHEHWFGHEYRDVLRHARLVVNMGPFQVYGQNVVDVPPGIMNHWDVDRLSEIHEVELRGPHFRIIENECRDIPVLFYGSLTPRRAQMLEALSRAGIHVTALYGVLGPARDRFIDRAKVVLDLKQEGTEPDDQTRSWWPLSRGVCVLSENAPASATDACKLTPETIVQRVRYALDVGAEGRRRLHSAYALALGLCDVSPMLKALGL